MTNKAKKGTVRPDFRARFGGKHLAGGRREQSVVGLLAEERELATAAGLKLLPRTMPKQSPSK
jgi:hypothetical protein